MTPSEIPPPQALDYRDRKVGLVIFGILTMLAGLICALFVPLVIFAQVAAARQAQPPMASGPLGMVVAIYGLTAVALIWLGIGSIMARRWARALLLVCSWGLMICGILGIAAAAFTLRSSLRGGGDARSTRAAPPPEVIYWLTLGFLGFLFVVLPVVWILFYGSRNVRLSCEARDPVERWTDRCPLPVLAAVLWLAFGGITFLVLPFSPFRLLPCFGFFITGPGAIFGYILIGLIWLYAARALYRLEWIGWWIAVTFAVLYADFDDADLSPA